MVTIWAKDFNASSVDDCTPSQDLLYSFSGDTYEPSFTYTCENVDAFDAELPVRIWVADGGVDHNCNGQISWNERNKDYCTTTIVISDNDDVCSGSGSLVSGEVLTHDDLEPVSLTTIHLKTGSAVTSSVVTEEDGQYSLYVPMGASARIEAERNDDHMNGVSTLDLVRIQKHLLGIAPFETPYQFIAADANNSEAVSAIDLVEIRKLILGIYLEYPNNKSWRFVQKGYEFQDAMHPWPFEEGINLTEVTESLSGNDFMAIKIGDVNNTAVANANEVEIRGGNAAFDLKIDDQKVSRGQNVRIPVFAADVTQLLGMQFTMETTGLQYVGIESGSISISDDNVGVFDQALTLSWNQISSSTVGGEEPLFTLIFESATVSDLKDLLTITNQITESEAYDQTENIMDISLRFDDGTNSSEEFALFQNEPNPFANRSIIGFILPQNADVDLKIHDAAGRIVREVNGDFAKGYNQIEISTGKGLETGVYYYTLTVEGYTATKKMLILK